MHIHLGYMWMQGEENHSKTVNPDKKGQKKIGQLIIQKKPMSVAISVRVGKSAQPSVR